MTALAVALQSESVIARYLAKLVIVPADLCVWWTGAISGRGHGRFWIGRLVPGPTVTMIAHRFAWGLAYGPHAVEAAPLLAHECDNPLCQNVEHLRPRSTAGNGADWSSRRHRVGGPLRDERGTRRRCLDLRAAIRAGHDVHEASDTGVSALDRDQLHLW